MKLWKSFSLSLSLCVATLSAFGDVTSVNVVGYINLPIRTGGNLIANQLYSTNNTLNNLFSTGIPDGSTCTKWDGGTQGFLPLSYYSAGAGWSINYDLIAGQGALFNSVANFTNTFVGEVHGFTGDTLVFEYPTVGPGTYLLSCSLPYGAATFNNIIGRDPLENESVRRLDSLSQDYLTTTFVNGTWDNGAPELGIGESAFFRIVSPTSPVPEPGVIVLFACGVFIFGASRIVFKSKK